MITNLYQYPELTRVEKNDVRYYQDSLSNLVPSVTTILSATGDHSGIDAWKRRVGPKTAKVQDSLEYLLCLGHKTLVLPCMMQIQFSHNIIIYANQQRPLIARLLAMYAMLGFSYFYPFDS